MADRNAQRIDAARARASRIWVGAALAALGCTLAAACGDDGGSEGSGGGAGTDAGPDALPDGAGGDANPGPPGDPEPLAVPEWMVASVLSASSDPVLPAIEQGTLSLPPAGDYLGLTWSPVVPGENGALIEASADLIYAVARITIPEGHRVLARGDTVAGLYVDGAHRQPGDYYHSRKLRVPLAARSSEALVVVRALGRRKAPEVELWTTRAELYPNVADVTLPDLVVGSSDPRPLGVAVLNLLDAPVAEVQATVIDNASFAATSVTIPSLAPASVTQVPFLLQPKSAPTSADAPLLVQLRLESSTLSWSYETELEVPVVAEGARYRRTRVSDVDGSVQYAAVMPPASPSAGQKYGLILSLHGASVEASGQASSYSPKSWAYLVAPTNRRPFGFDWEEWGRLDAIEALDDALASLPIDPLRVHLAGHSMGGHGSWHVGVHFSDRFALIGPSAGWIDFESYSGQAPATGPIGRARSASQTLEFVNNLANDAVYIIHGLNDDNVPVWHGKTMYSKLQPIVSELTYHEQPNAGHWWDLDPQEEGADCVDWDPMITLMEQRQRDPTPLDFDYTSPGPWVNGRHGFVQVTSVTSPMQNVHIQSTSNATQVDLVTQNVRSMVLDGAALAQKGVTTVTVDGAPHAVGSAPIVIGPQSGKRVGLSGPLNQVWQKPFCYVWDDAGPGVYRDYVSLVVSTWSTIGNGHACGLPLSAVDAEIESTKNLIFVGVAAPAGAGLPFGWSATELDLAGKKLQNAALAFVYPKGDRLHAYVVATEGSEHLLFRYVPFSSRAGMPDFFAWGASGSIASGFFDADWNVDPSFATGL